MSKLYRRIGIGSIVILALTVATLWQQQRSKSAFESNDPKLSGLSEQVIALHSEDPDVAGPAARKIGDGVIDGSLVLSEADQKAIDALIRKWVTNAENGRNPSDWNNVLLRIEQLWWSAKPELLRLAGSFEYNKIKMSRWEFLAETLNLMRDREIIETLIAMREKETHPVKRSLIDYILYSMAVPSQPFVKNRPYMDWEATEKLYDELIFPVLNKKRREIYSSSVPPLPLPPPLKTQQ